MMSDDLCAGPDPNAPVKVEITLTANDREVLNELETARSYLKAAEERQRRAENESYNAKSAVDSGRKMVAAAETKAAARFVKLLTENLLQPEPSPAGGNGDG